jgi:hypothetical protein
MHSSQCVHLHVSHKKTIQQMWAIFDVTGSTLEVGGEFGAGV